MDFIYIEYDDLLIGRKDLDIYNFYGTEPGGANERRALSCIRYCLEQVLQWDADTSIKKFDRYMIHLMKLDKVVTYIDYPIEAEEGAPRYILSLLYPDKVKIDPHSLTIETFREVLKMEGKQFPRDYFSGETGFKRFASCLKYLIENYELFNTTEELYQYFSSPAGNKLLHRYRLKVPAELFSIHTLDVIRYITRNDPNSELYYCFYQFNTALDELKNPKNSPATVKLVDAAELEGA